MDLGLAVLLGIVQGLTEFFPVSSSGHLALLGAWFGLEEPDLRFDIFVHLATLAAILVYFRKDWFQLWRLLWRGERGDLPAAVLPYLALSIVPAGLVGVFLKDAITTVHGNPSIVGICLIVTGVTLLLGLRLRGEGLALERLDWLVVAAMALAQAAAVLPGISRAGATIMAALFLGMGRHAAARFSFLMAVPVIARAGLLELVGLMGEAEPLAQGQAASYGAGFAAAMLSGFVALVFLMRLLQGRRFFWFGVYCLALGTAAIITA